jgi:carbohydrate kinase (thermoresistant glucokinase family)
MLDCVSMTKRDAARFVVVMGVPGAGKSTIGAVLAEKLGWPFVDGDDLHPPANLRKMQAGVPLDDDDRAPWLAAIAQQLSRWRAAGRGGVVACSALKRGYRESIAGGNGDVLFAYLKGTEKLLAARVAARRGHFMPASLLASQLAILEEPDADEPAVTVDAALPAARIVAVIVQRVCGEGM